MEEKVPQLIIRFKLSKPKEPHGSLTKEELRKERRREANRRCVQRKRKREQETFQELEGSVAKLRTEVQLLHEELTRLDKENKELDEENNSIQEEIYKMHGMELSAKFVISSAVDEV
ncbi:G-box-binding factor 1-like isoform X2 [Arachis duranensis]|uniref:G-box-binding factor 1-like isoform X2 n=1 Tax=Arachis duranensis TaxID=130453 RepID=A0A9C6WLD9_ARADU|nr:G-box-binding factor 1-like isoform X2 [Arachis duranensis]